MKSAILVLSSFLLSAAPVWAQGRIVSPEVHEDHTVTFRFRDPNAKQVFLQLEGAPREAMEKGTNGVWSVTTAALEPDFYGYNFVADGVSLCDPRNTLLKTNLVNLSNMVHVPGPPTASWEVSDVPHGVVHHHYYKSAVVGDERDFYVYTPPGYDPAAERRYPTLYLLHGMSDGAAAWTDVGRANVILDNLIAWGKAVPMVVVMPLGYGAPEILTRESTPELEERNYGRFQEALLTEVIPRVEKDYRVRPDREDRAIAGLSMGGAETLLLALNHSDVFAWAGAFSAGTPARGPEATYPGLDASINDRLHVLWIACGSDDPRVVNVRKFQGWLSAKGIHHTDIEIAGAHVWMVWRRNLTAFAPLLFRVESAAQ